MPKNTAKVAKQNILMPITALVPIANGSEEIESVCIIDTLRRAGIAVTVAKVVELGNVEDSKTLQITASRLVKLVADVYMSDV